MEPPEVNNSVIALWSVLTAKYGVLASVPAWVGTFSLCLRWVAKRMQRRMTDWLDRVAESQGTIDDDLARRILTNRVYVAVQLVVDVLISVRLPTADALTVHRQAGGSTP